MLLDRFRFTATLISGGGKDSRGNNAPETETPLHGCLIALNPKSELDNLSDVSETRATLYFNHDAKVLKTDRIRIPEGTPLPNTTWAVDGDVIYWPLVTQVNLRKE